MTEHYILLKVSCSKEDPDLLDKIAGRAWTMDSVEDVTATVVDDDVVKDAERYFPPEFEVWQGDEMCASASGPREEALREIMRYAAQYEQDGPVRVFEVTRTFIDAAILKEGK